MMQADDAPPAAPIPLVANPPPTNNPIPAKLLPYPLFDVALDLSFPGSSGPNATEVIYPPSGAGSGIVDILPLDQLMAEFGPETSLDDGTQQMSQGGAKIARFAFPEYNDGVNAQEVANRNALAQRTYGGGTNTSPGLNRHDIYLEEAFTVPSENSGTKGPSLPSYHTFSHRLANGCVIHGHVRRYLTPRTENERSDVGRRSIRAIVVLTRNPGGGGRLHTAMLKTLEVLRYKPNKDNDRKWFLQSMFQEHVNLCRDVGAAMAGGGQSPLSKPRIITIPLLEAGRGHGLFGNVDTIKFACPPSFLHEREPAVNDSISGLSRNDMMPMLRCLGVTRTMRLLSALVSERRVILTSCNVSKLSAVGYGAMAMMGQGLLPPPSVFVPVLPPGLASLLSTSSAYVIGVLKGATPNFIDMRSMVLSLGEVVIFDLDGSGNEPYFAGIANPIAAVPDLTRRNFEDVGDSSLNGMSIADMLYQDLVEVIKLDKKQMFWQGAVQEKLGMAAEKGKTAAKAAMKKGLSYLKNKKRSMEAKEMGAAIDDEEEEAENQVDNANSLTKFVGKGNYFYEQGFPNETAEVEARIAFATFFVSLFGDLRSYLTQSTPGVAPTADKEKFIKYRGVNGDLPGSSMYNLIQNFLRSSLFDQFVDARLRELQLRRAVPEDAPLFALTANFHRSNKIDFIANQIRQSVRQVAMNPNLPGKYLTEWNDGIRRKVLDLTSTQAYNGDPGKTLSALFQDCHESTSILVDTVMILWTRIQEGKGMQWKKALLALQAFRDLLLYGPINAVAESIDGLSSIRIMRSYADALRAQNSKLVRDVAAEVYDLTVNLPVLFARRRASLNKLRLAKDPKPPLRKETRMIKGVSQFRNVHIALRPAGATVAPAPPSVNDLLGQAAPTDAPFPQQPQPVPNYCSDLLSLGAEATAVHKQNTPNPFDMAGMSQNIPAVTATTNTAPANQTTAPGSANLTPRDSMSSHPQSSGEMSRVSPTTFSQSNQQSMMQNQNTPAAFSTEQTPQHVFNQPHVGSAPFYTHPMQQQINQQPLMQHRHSAPVPVPPQQMLHPQQPRHTIAFGQQPQQPQPMQQMQQPPHQWGHAPQQSVPPYHQPQGFQASMSPQNYQEGCQQQQQFQQGIPPQQHPPQQQSKPNMSMFDPMAK